MILATLLLTLHALLAAHHQQVLDDIDVEVIRFQAGHLEPHDDLVVALLHLGGHHAPAQRAVHQFVFRTADLVTVLAEWLEARNRPRGALTQLLPALGQRFPGAIQSPSQVSQSAHVFHLLHLIRFSLPPVMGISGRDYNAAVRHSLARPELIRYLVLKLQHRHNM